MLSQQAYAEELLRINAVKPTALGRIPCPRDLAWFDVLLTDEPPTDEDVRTAQRLTGEILWLSQRTRPGCFERIHCIFFNVDVCHRLFVVADNVLCYNSGVARSF